MRKPIESMDLFAARRKKVSDKIKGSALILSSMPEKLRQHDVHFPFRQDSNIYYLTGFDEPETILLMRPGLSQGPDCVLFVRSKNVERETWDGFRYGPSATEKIFNIEKVYDIQDFEKVAPQLLIGSEKLYYSFYKNFRMDQRIETVLETVKSSQGRTGRGLLSVHDSYEMMGEFRIKKDEAGLANQRKACEISAETHLETMKYIRPGMNEREIQGFLTYQFLKRGASREGYNSIVAAGANATTLHYVFNDQPCLKEDLILIDAGGEYNYFTGDITRTYPIGGKFSAPQKRVYQGVLDVQKKVMALIKPGLPFQTLHDEAESLLTDLMLDLKLVHGRKEDIIAKKEHRKYYPHGLGHYLGMDVHDSGLYRTFSNHARPIEENMVFTVEPGLYIPATDESAPEELRGIGVRIEDNIVVTAAGFENMTAKAPKEIADLEAIVGK